MNGTKQAVDTREVFVWHGANRDDDLARLISLLAPKVLCELFSEEGKLVQLRDGQFVRVIKEDMREIVNRHIRTLRLINQGTADEPNWEVKLYSFEFPLAGSKNDLTGPNERTLVDLIDALVPLVAKAPSQPRQLRPQQLSEIKMRLASNEPAPRIAASYNVEVDVIREIARAR
jgi:hypothetical protein